jgi:mannose-6-phosphate isomerase-like protein (cupin superfamily)
VAIAAQRPNKEVKMSTKDLGFRVLQADDGQQFSVLGAAMIYKATADETRGAYSLAIETTPPGGGLPLHVHSREDEAMYVLEGEYEIECGGEVTRATPGMFVFLPRGTPNRYRNCGASPSRFIYITSPGGFEGLVAETSEATRDGAPDMHEVQEIAKRHGVEFV